MKTNKIKRTFDQSMEICRLWNELATSDHMLSDIKEVDRMIEERGVFVPPYFDEIMIRVPGDISRTGKSHRFFFNRQGDLTALKPGGFGKTP